MKIVHIIYDSIGNPWLNGGGAKRTQALYEQLADKHRVTIVCGNFSEAPAEINGVKYNHIGLKLNYTTSRFSYVLLAWIYALTHKADIWVEDIGFPFPLLLPLIKSNAYGSVQFIPNSTYTIKRGLIGKVTKFGFEHGLKFYKNIITVSEYAADNFKKFAPKSKIIILENGVTATSLKSGKPTYFLYIGRIDIYGKGLDILIDAIEIVIKQNSGINFVIAGNGEAKDISTLKNLVENKGLKRHVKFVGYISEDKKPKLFADAIAVVLPSRNETSSISALEAFNYGKPVIGSDAGGLGEILSKSKAGIKCKSENTQELATAILKISEDKILSDKLSALGNKFIKKNTWAYLAKRYENVLLERRSP
jgi:glycosyltransferase involved in cell wall biosynthesis